MNANILQSIISKTTNPFKFKTINSTFYNLDYNLDGVYTVPFGQIVAFHELFPAVKIHCNIHGCKITDLTPVRHARILDISYCMLIENTHVLGNQDKLYMTKCPIFDINNLVNVKKLVLDTNPIVTLPQCNCDELHITSIEIPDRTVLSGVKNLYIM